MPSAEPIKDLLKAAQENRSGDKEASASLLAASLGSPEVTPMMRENLDTLLDPDSPANDAVLEIVSSEVSKGKRSYP